MTGRVEPSLWPLLAPPRRDNVRFGASVYGSFLVASVVGVAFETGQDARFMTTTAFGSMLVFWLAHWWSEVIGAQISLGEDFGRRDVLVIAGREWPLVAAAVVPTLLLGLAWAGVWSRETGAALALTTAVLQIVGWALLAGRRAAWTWLRASLFAAVEGALRTADRDDGDALRAEIAASPVPATRARPGRWRLRRARLRGRPRARSATAVVRRASPHARSRDAAPRFANGRTRRKTRPVRP